MRLIDADELKLCYTGSDTNKASYLSIRKMIDTSKTAYDVENTVKKLEEQEKQYLLKVKMMDVYYLWLPVILKLIILNSNKNLV